MAEKSLSFYQVYYKDEHLKEVYPFAKLIKNHSVSHFFENSIIADQVPNTDSDLISVCSWRLRQKRGDGPCEIILKKEGKFDLNEERILNEDYDISILTPRKPSHDVFALSRNWHGQAWVDAFNILKPFLYSTQRIKIGDDLIGNAIYENHFIATKQIYHEYVTTCLQPTIAFMCTNPVFFVNSNYRLRKKKEEVEEYTKATGRSDWPIAPFILERLFRIWIDRKGFKIINL